MPKPAQAARRISLTLDAEHIAKLDDACRESGYSRSEIVMGMIDVDTEERARMAARRARRIATK